MDVQVHLVPVEVGVVGTGVAEVHPEGGPGQHLDPVAHHTHLVEGGLSVEDHQVAVPHVSLHLVAALHRGEMLVNSRVSIIFFLKIFTM